MIQQLNPQIIQPAMKKACSVLDILLRAGFSAYFVGGAVRDTLLGKSIHDVDIATSATPEQVLQLFPHSIPTGLQHGTVTVVLEKVTYEVTTYRAESQYDDFRRPSEVVFVDELELDLQRRDFTMNAMAIDRNWQLYDPYGGQTDLRNGILSTVGASAERFQEDALRMLRAIRFALTYNLSMSDDCQRAIWEHGRLLEHIAMERVAYEMTRMLSGASCADVCSMLQQSRLLIYTKEKLWISSASLQSSLIHKYKVEVQGIAHMDSVNWAHLFHIFGVSSHHAEQDMQALRLSNQLQSEVTTMLQLTEWLLAEEADISDEAGLKETAGSASNRQEAAFQNEQEQKVKLSGQLKQQWLNKLLTYPQKQLELWLNYFEWRFPIVSSLRQYHVSLPIHSLKELAVGGKHILQWCEKPAGPWVKEVLHQLFLAVASGELYNDKAAIKLYIQAWNEGEFKR